MTSTPVQPHVLDYPMFEKPHVSKPTLDGAVAENLSARVGIPTYRLRMLFDRALDAGLTGRGPWDALNSWTEPGGKHDSRNRSLIAHDRSCEVIADPAERAARSNHCRVVEISAVRWIASGQPATGPCWRPGSLSCLGAPLYADGQSYGGQIGSVVAEINTAGRHPGNDGDLRIWCSIDDEGAPHDEWLAAAAYGELSVRIALVPETVVHERHPGRGIESAVAAGVHLGPLVPLQRGVFPEAQIVAVRRQSPGAS